jgi:calcium-dependent protein kinase
MLMEVAKLIIQVSITDSEWVIATINKQKLLSNDKLEQAFRLFDRDNSGSISADEVKDVLGAGRKIDDEIWKNIILEVDENGDGEISF